MWLINIYMGGLKTPSTFSLIWTKHYLVSEPTLVTLRICEGLCRDEPWDILEVSRFRPTLSNDPWHMQFDTWQWNSIWLLIISWNLNPHILELGSFVIQTTIINICKIEANETTYWNIPLVRWNHRSANLVSWFNTIFGNRRRYENFETIQGHGFQIWTNANNMEISYFKLKIRLSDIMHQTEPKSEPYLKILVYKMRDCCQWKEKYEE